MLVQFQHSDANSLCMFNPTKPTPPNVGVSIFPPLKKCDSQSKRRHQKHVLHFPNVGRKPNPIVEKPGVNHDFLFANSDATGQIEGTSEVKSRSAVAAQESRPRNSLHKIGKNGVFRRPKVNRRGKSTNSGESSGELRSGSVVEKVHTKCSTKLRRYGGCIPAMLEAVEKISDLDEALKPWEMTLTNKERSILLKEQANWERAIAIFDWFKRKGCYEVNVIHYNIMLRILGRARQWREVDRLCCEMMKTGIELVNSTYGTLIDVYSKGGLREEAMKWLELMNEHRMKPDEVTMGIVVQMYKKAGDFNAAEDFFKKWSRVVKSSGKEGCSDGDSSDDVQLSTYTYNTLIDTYAKGGKLQEASKTFERMLGNSVLATTVTFNTMIHMYGNNGQLDKVASLMKRMEEASCSPDNRTYNILISLHAKHNDIESAARYLAEMKESSLEPDVVTYRTLLYAFSIRRMVAEAEELISEMDEKGLEIDEFTQSSLTRMYIEAGMLEKSMLWFWRFHLRGNMTSECYSANIDAFGERGYVLEARKVFDCCLKVKKLTVLEFNVMIKAYGIGKEFDQACCLFDSMEKHGLVPDRCGHNSLVQMLASSDLPQRAVIYLRKMWEAGLVDDCVPYCAVISSYTKRGDVDTAVRLYKEMIGCGIMPDVIVYGVLINAFADTGDMNEATSCINTMQRCFGLPMNNVICKSLIKLYTKMGHLKEAQKAYEMLSSFEVEPDVYSLNCMIDLYSERSMVSEAERIFETLKEKGNANEFTYAMMLCMYKRNGMFVKAFGVARKMRELGLMRDVLSYNNVLGLYASDGRYKEAMTTFSEMLKGSIEPDECTFKALGVILVKCGVSKEGVERLELKRRMDRKNGLRLWSSALSSVVELET